MPDVTIKGLEVGQSVTVTLEPAIWDEFWFGTDDEPPPGEEVVEEKEKPNLKAVSRKKAVGE